jgi:hypothetical protein
MFLKYKNLLVFQCIFFSNRVLKKWTLVASFVTLQICM